MIKEESSQESEYTQSQTHVEILAQLLKKKKKFEKCVSKKSICF